MEKNIGIARALSSDICQANMVQQDQGGGEKQKKILIKTTPRRARIISYWI